MEYVNGPDLIAVVEAGHLSQWQDILRVSHDIARTLQAAHNLPARVLHRDLRPQNIMLRDFYSGPEIAEVVLLDFDLSWHLDAAELSVQPNTGYAAPEQIKRSKNETTRSALVDSFGLGMTLYFLLSSQEPMLAQHKHTEWDKTLKDAARNKPCSQWKSLPMRFARLIGLATADRQHERWDMAQIAGELERLKEAVADPAMARHGFKVAPGCATVYAFEDYFLDAGAVEGQLRDVQKALRKDLPGEDAVRGFAQPCYETPEKQRWLVELAARTP
jgi:eukaryotic-like serine/threonine-protein kinase